MKTISATEAKGQIGNVAIIDVRTESEFAEGHIAGAVNIDINSFTFDDKIKNLDTTKEYLVYCQSGGRSARACSIMSELGFKNVVNLDGGISTWKGEGFEVEK